MAKESKLNAFAKGAVEGIIANQFMDQSGNPKYQAGRFSSLNPYSDLNQASVDFGSGGKVYEQVLNKTKNNPRLEAASGAIPFEGVAEQVGNVIGGWFQKNPTAVSDWIHGTSNHYSTDKIGNFNDYKEHLKKVGGM